TIAPGSVTVTGAGAGLGAFTVNFQNVPGTSLPLLSPASSLTGTAPTITVVPSPNNGTFVLAGNNSGFTGALTLTGGNLGVTNSNSLGGTVTLSGGTLTALGVGIATTSGATESGTTVTITTTAPHNFAAGQQVTISGV